ncbi:MAG TPA: sigma-70 family RNA polymerase sigma factor [Patescibacteria group bacterium]|nr:sigma-70 family RNA polymerase sigma factor [Patescibacteria group bacterium]
MGNTGRSGHGVTLPKFMQQALKHGIMTREEERKTARRARRAPHEHPTAKSARKARERLDAAYRARDALVTSNLRFILQQALHHSRFGETDPDDAFQEAVMGHLEAIARFKTSAGTRLSTYSAWWIRHAVMRYGQDNGRTVRVPINTLVKARKLSKAAQQFERKHGRLPDDDELSAITGIPRKRIDAVRIAVMEACSLDEIRRDAEGQGRTMQEMIPDPQPGVDDAIAREGDIAAVRAAMAALTPFEAAIIRCRFVEDKTLVETAQALAGQSRRGGELSRERIRQIETVALRKLRDALTANDPS